MKAKLFVFCPCCWVSPTYRVLNPLLHCHRVSFHYTKIKTYSFRNKLGKILDWNFQAWSWKQCRLWCDGEFHVKKYATTLCRQNGAIHRQAGFYWLHTTLHAWLMEHPHIIMQEHMLYGLVNCIITMYKTRSVNVTDWNHIYESL